MEKKPRPSKAKKKVPQRKPKSKKSSAVVDPKTGLTSKELKFCQEYILDYNCARACRDVSISHQSRRAHGLIKEPKIVAEIERLEQAVGKKLKVKAQDIAAGLLFIAKRCSQKGKDKWNPRAAVQAYSRLGAYTGGFREETNVNHKLTVRENGPDFSKMEPKEIKEWIAKKRAARESRAKS